MSDIRTQQELRDDRSDAILDRMDTICDRLTDKMEGLATTLVGVDVRLNNHLSHHEKLEKYLIYPIALALLLGIGTFVWTILRSHI